MNAAVDGTAWGVTESAATSTTTTATSAAQATAALCLRRTVTALIDSLTTSSGSSLASTGNAGNIDNHPSKKAKTQDKDGHFIRPYPVPPADTANPLHNAPPATRNLLLTLHVLFPHALLPALDLLDRGQVLRVPRALSSSSSGAGDLGLATLTPLLLVRSSRQSRDPPRQQRHHQHNQPSRRPGGSTAAAAYDSDGALDADGSSMVTTGSAA